MTISELKEYGRKELNSIDDCNIKLNILLKYVLGLDENKLIILKDEHIIQSKVNTYKKYIEKVKKGMPIQYITNKQEFMGLNFYVDENVLIPRPDTEMLVEEVIRISNNIKEPKILDMCTGSGAIGVSLAKYVKSSIVTGVDISKKALQVAKKNAQINNAKIELIESNLFEKLHRRKFDIIVSNPPYIRKSVIKELEKDVQNEPIIALDGGEDGLDFYREITNNSKEFLNEKGILCMEIGYDQKEEVEEILNNSNIFKETYCVKDYANNDRVMVAKMK